MALETTTLTRVFLHGSARLTDPDSTMSVVEVKTLYAAAYPELLTAEVFGPNQNGTNLEYEFRKAVGTKG